MNLKKFPIILVVLFLIELTTARTVRLYETIIKANGDRIVRNWSSDDGNETESELKNNVEYALGIDDEDIIKTASLISDFGRDYIGQLEGNDVKNWPATEQQATEEIAGIKPNGVRVPLVNTGSFNGTQIIFIGNEPDSLKGWAKNRLHYESRNQNLSQNDKTTNDVEKKLDHETKDDSLDALLAELFSKNYKTTNDAVKEIDHHETKDDSLEALLAELFPKNDKITNDADKEIDHHDNNELSLDDLLAELFKTEETTITPATKTTMGPDESSERRLNEIDQYYPILEENYRGNYLKLEDIR